MVSALLPATRVTVSVLAAAIFVPTVAFLPGASADTARVSWWQSADASAGIAIVITGSNGVKRTLGRYDFGTTTLALRISPDRQQIAVVPYAPSSLRKIWIVPTNGGPARTLAIDPSVRNVTEGTAAWWTPDSQELVIGDTMQVAARKQWYPYRSRVLRCRPSAGRCAAIPGVDGVVATIPGGIVTSTSPGSLLPYDPGWVDDDQGWRVVERDRATLRRFEVRRQTRTVLLTDAPRILTSRTASLAAGVDGAFAASASSLVRTTFGRRTPRGAARLTVVGHEAATDSAVVRLSWPEERRSDVTHRNATVRVPLDGRTRPTVISRFDEGEAW